MRTKFQFFKMEESPGDGWWCWFYNNNEFRESYFTVHVKMVKMVTFGSVCFTTILKGLVLQEEKPPGWSYACGDS